jgi:hypothetical protein
MGVISAASNEQAIGVAQVGEALTQMDQATQQNAAPAEQMAAAASSLNAQSQTLVQTVAVFKVVGALVWRWWALPEYVYEWLKKLEHSVGPVSPALGLLLTFGAALLTHDNALF